jgi:copper oxidase (laccase) domain-containing protein
MSNEFIISKPRIFQRPELDWLQYAETRRDEPVDLRGNMSDDPRVLNRGTYDLIQPGIPYEQWLEQEKAAVSDRVVALKGLYGISRIAMPRPAQSTELVRLDSAMKEVDEAVSAENRAFADATFLTTPGEATMFAPADCIVATVAYPKQRAVGQIHIGFRGATRNIIQSTLSTFESEGYSPTDAVVYLSPHVQSGFPLNQAETKELKTILNEITPEQRSVVTKYTKDITKSPVMDLTNLALDEFENAHVPKDNIEVSAADTFTDPTLYSDFNKKQRGVTGRFGVIAGIAK